MRAASVIPGADLAAMLGVTAERQRMNIYYFDWTQDGGFGLSAVVVATTESEALSTLDLDDPDNSDIRVVLMGVCTDGSTIAHTVCHESL